ncbi:MAG: glycosyltransferase family 39 protein [Patescibacteria group bacterium]
MKKLLNKIKNFLVKFKYEFIVFTLFVLMRVPSLGHDNFNTDVWRWKARSYDFGTGISSGNFKNTLQKYHPGVTLMWISGVAVKINSAYSMLTNTSLSADDNIGVIFQLDFMQKFLIVCVIGLVLSLVFYVLRNVFGLKYALISIFFLSFEPFYLALTRVIHLEGLVSTFMLASVVWLYYYFLSDKNYKRLIISGIFAGLALLTKTSAIFLLPFCSLSTIIFLLEKRKGDKADAKKVLLMFLKTFFMWFGVLMTTFFVFWPAMWVQPLVVFKTLYEGIASVGVEGDHIQYYFGKLVENPGPSFYFVVLGFRSSIYLLIGFIGSLFVRKKLSPDLRKFMDFLLIFVFFYFIQLTLPSKKLDRYILPELVVMSLVSSMFFIWMFEKLNFKKIQIVIFMIPAILTALYLHPEYMSYYNPMFGGIKTGVKVLEPKWLIGTSNVVKYFKDVSKRDNLKPSYNTSFEELVYVHHGSNLDPLLTVAFREKYYTQIWPFFREFGAWPVIESLTPFAERTKYFVYPVWDDTASVENRFRLRYVDTIKLRDAPLYNVYFNETPVNDR